MGETSKTMLKKIETEVDELSSEDQLELVERLIHKIRENGLNKKYYLNWAELYGMGKGLWVGEDAQDYVNRLRENR